MKYLTEQEGNLYYMYTVLLPPNQIRWRGGWYKIETLTLMNIVIKFNICKNTLLPPTVVIVHVDKGS